jgi:large subunit ribosomal protein L21
MYAIFEAKGKQFRAEPEVTLRLPSLDAEPGDRVTFDQVLLAQRDDRVIVGSGRQDRGVQDEAAERIPP